MYNLLVKILASFLASLMTLFGFTLDLPGFSDENVSSTEIQYLNEDKGSMDALISISTTTDGEYKLYWADENFEKLTYTLTSGEIEYSEFAAITTYFGEGSLDTPDYTAIPDDAENILVTLDGKVLEVIAIPEEKQIDRGEKLYSFGSISDLHFNRYDMEDGSDVAESTFSAALNFFEDAAVTLVAMPGDISTDGEKEAFMSFEATASQYDFPVYTTTGNHDLRSEYKKENWLSHMNKGAYGTEKADAIINVADNGMDFVYRESTTGDIFIFLCQTSNNYGLIFNSLLQPSQLDWLSAQLEEYKDESVYLFFHTFLSDYNNNPFTATGNVQNNLGWAYPLFYTIGANDEIRLKNLLSKYDNVTFFNGHSHWAYHMQYMNENLNISKNGENGATFVHVSSVSSPRTTDGFQILWSGNDPGMSEGLLVEVYEDTILLMGVDFVNGRILAYATYESAK